VSGRTWIWKHFPWRAAALVIPGSITVFVLHRFRSPDRNVSGTDPAALAGTLEYLRHHRIPIWDLTTLLQHADAGTPFPSRGVVFTVDDGYADFPEVGMPVFAAFDSPVTLFVPTGFIDREYWFWWDRLAYAFLRTDRGVVQLDLSPAPIRFDCTTPEARRASVGSLMQLTSLPHTTKTEIFGRLELALGVPIPDTPPPEHEPASWDALRAAVPRGLRCGPHTVTHPILWTATTEVMAAEISGSITTLRERMPGGVTEVFAYPQGNLSGRELEYLSAIGCPAAVLSDGGSVQLAEHLRSHAAARYLIPRQGFEDPVHRHRQAIFGIEQIKQRVWSAAGRSAPRWRGRTPDGGSPLSTAGPA
jgi:peptidoglycan/xylan/chitin deacetylase (PgdA/CDA1 family)